MDLDLSSIGNQFDHGLVHLRDKVQSKIQRGKKKCLPPRSNTIPRMIKPMIVMTLMDLKEKSILDSVTMYFV